jgi:hypothetical protein
MRILIAIFISISISISMLQKKNTKKIKNYTIYICILGRRRGGGVSSL